MLANVTTEPRRAAAMHRRPQLMLAGPIVPSTNLDESLTRGKESSYAWPSLMHGAMELLVRSVAAPHPNHLRWRAMLPEQFREIIVLRYDHNRAVGTPASREDTGSRARSRPSSSTCTVSTPCSVRSHRARAVGN